MLALAVAYGPAALAGSDPELTLIQSQGKASILVRNPGDDPLKVKLSQTLTIVMRVDGTAPLDVQFSQKTSSTPAWQLEAIGLPKTTVKGGPGRIRWEQTFTATPLGDTGLQPLPLPAVQITENKDPPQQVKWAPLPLIVVTRVARADISEARDLAPIEELPRPQSTAPPLWLWISAGLGVCLVSASVWIVLRRRPQPALQPTAGELALKEFAGLRALPLLSPADIDRWHTRLSDVLRRYLEKHFDLPATRQTTPEFFASCTRSHPLTDDQRELLTKILQRCDEAKFAAALPEARECLEVVDWAVDFVQGTGKEQPQMNQEKDNP
jgi:hypothetical protein